MVDPKSFGDIWRLPLNGDRKPIPFLQGPAGESHGQLSPDGRWLVYSSNESRRTEIFVQSFPVPGTKFQLTTDGGNFPRWRGDGKEILFMALRGRTYGTLSVPVQPAGEGLKFGSPQPLFDSGYTNFAHSTSGGGTYHTFAVSADGQRFIVPLQRDDDAEANSPLIVVSNWTAALGR
jgi:Tol biopolymer transport system component